MGNFFRHADPDPESVLENFHPEMGVGLSGWHHFSSAVSRGISLSRWEACDCWVETLDADKLAVSKGGQNLERAASAQCIRNLLKQATREVRMAYAKKHYLFFLANRDRLQDEVNESREAGKRHQQILDENLKA